MTIPTGTRVQYVGTLTDYHGPATITGVCDCDRCWDNTSLRYTLETSTQVPLMHVNPRSITTSHPRGRCRMTTFHSDPALKALLLERIAAHEAADRIVQGKYWSAGADGVFRGCAVGCSLRDLTDTEGPPPGGWHAEMERRFGITKRLAQWEDAIFEGLPADEARAWPRRFAEAVPVGVDLDGLPDQLWADASTSWSSSADRLIELLDAFSTEYDRVNRS